MWSFILEYENEYNPYEIRKSIIIRWKSIASEIVVSNEEIIVFAEKLKELGISSKDALHVSCGVYSGCDYFITTDKKLLNLKIDEIKICNPMDFIIEMEG